MRDLQRRARGDSGNGLMSYIRGLGISVPDLILS